MSEGARLARKQAMPGTAVPGRNGLALAAWALLWVGLLLACATRLLTMDVNILNVDEASYAASAVRALDTGSLVLKASRDNKPPGIVAAYAVAFKAFGRYQMPAVRVLALGCVVATALILYAFCSRWLSTAAGASAAGLYLFATSLDLRFLAFKTELLMNLPLCAAVGLGADALLDSTRGAVARRLQLVLAGLFLALAIATRQTAAIIFLGMWTGLLLGLRTRLGLARMAEDCFFGVAGTLIGLGGLALVYMQGNAWDEMWRQAVEFPRDFAATQRFSAGQRIVRFVTYLAEYFQYAQILFMLALAGLIIGRGMSSDKLRAGITLHPMATLGLAASLIAFAAAPDMYHAYFLQLFLPLSIALALCVHVLLDVVDGGAARSVIALLMGTALASGAVSALKDPVKHALGQARLGQHHPFDPLLRSAARPGDKLYVWGFRPQFYLNSGLSPATRFTLTDLLVGIDGAIGRVQDPKAKHPYYEPQGWQHFLEELAKERPRFIVDARYLANSANEAPISAYPALVEQIRLHYREVAKTPDQLTLYERIPTPP